MIKYLKIKEKIRKKNSFILKKTKKHFPWMLKNDFKPPKLNGKKNLFRKKIRIKQKKKKKFPCY